MSDDPKISIDVNGYMNVDRAWAWSNMLDRHWAREQKRKVLLRDEMPRGAAIGTSRAYVGVFSIAIPDNRERLLLSSAGMMTAAGWVTPGDIARLYLEQKYARRRRRMNTAQYQQFVKHVASAPTFCEPAHFEHAYYLDLKAAYFSIVKAVGWDVEYLRSEYIGKQSDNADFPLPTHKMARNILVSTVLPSEITIWDGQRYVQEKHNNPHINMVLWGLVMDVLNGIANDVVAAGASYVHTDGYIVGEERYAAVSEVLNSWGLPWGIKGEGQAEVKAVGCYTVGGLRTRTEHTGAGIASARFYDPNVNWLRPRIFHFASAVRTPNEDGRFI